MILPGIRSYGNHTDSHIVVKGNLIAQGTANSVSGNVLFEPWLHEGSVFEDFETGNFGGGLFSWTRPKKPYWFVFDQHSLSGTYSAQTPKMNHTNRAVLNSVVPCREGFVSFMFEIDSKDQSDLLQFYVDGKLVQAWRGTVATMTTPATDAYKVGEGVHTFTWAFTKADPGGYSPDFAFLDNIVIPRKVGQLEGIATTDVTGTKTPLIGATVVLSGNGKAFVTTTDDSGGYSFFNVPYGNYTLTITKDDYKETAKSVTVDSYGIAVVAETNVDGVDTSLLFTSDELTAAVDDATANMYTKDELDRAVKDALDAQPAKTRLIVLPID